MCLPARPSSSNGAGARSTPARHGSSGFTSLPHTTPPDPGVFADVEDADDRKNRNVEYDAFDDRYVNFLLGEIIPEVARRYAVTEDPDRWGICGGSSGGNCAFTAGWFRPDRFRRVYGCLCSFAQLPNGNPYPELIPSLPRKPLRIFMQVGHRDLNWNEPEANWLANNPRVAAALAEAGYDFRVAVGDGGHNPNHGGVFVARRAALVVAALHRMRDRSCLVITGAPGAGKSTVSRLVAQALVRSALLSGDHMNDLIVSGRVWALGEPADEAARQVRLCNENLSVLARNFADAGIAPVIDWIIPDREQLEHYVQALSPRPLLLVVLDPSVEQCRHRNATRRSDEQFAFDDHESLRASMRDGFGTLGWWLDTSDLSAEETASRIIASIPRMAQLTL